MSDTVSVRKGDLDILVAAVTSWAPHDVPMEASEAFARMLTAFDEAHATDEDAPGSEPEPAKGIVVERDGHPPRRFAATGWEVFATGPEAGDLVLDYEGGLIAQIGARQWDSVFCESAAITAISAGQQAAYDEDREADEINAQDSL